MSATLPTQLLLALVLLLPSATGSLAKTPAPANSVEESAATANKQAIGQVPGRQRGGARRGACGNTQAPLTALAPAQKVAKQSLPITYVGGLTVADRPTFWFYAPYQLSAELTAEFILQDAGEDIYRITLTEFAAIGLSPGFISVTLPDSIAPLEIGKTYQWYFKINCTAESPLFVKGGVQRIALAPSLARQLASSSPREQIELYRSNGIWYDAVATLGNLLRANPTDPAIQLDWTSLLRLLGINDIPIARMAP